MGLNLTYDPGQTPLTPEELDELKIKSIATRGELDELEQQNIEKAFEWLMGRSLSVDKILSEEFIFDLHKRMLGDVWSWAGIQRKSNKNIGVDWTQIRTELRALIVDTKYWIEHHVFSEDEIAIRFKYRLVSIHCFPNGNGRHSRLMADIIIEKIYGGELFTWGSGNLIQKGQTRSNYLTALKTGDVNSIDELLKFARS
ncbi:MAG: mobile mystery protein B [Bacteroidota bacterium]